MSFLIRNISGGVVTIDDLGLTLEIGEEYDLAQESPNDVHQSDDIRTRINASEIAVLEPLVAAGGSPHPPLNTLQSLAAINTTADSGYRIFGGELDQLDDVTLASQLPGQVIALVGSPVSSAVWTNVEPDAVLGAGLLGIGPWRYNTTTTPPPGSGRIRFNNANPELATLMYVHYDNNDGDDLTTLLSVVGSGSIFYAQNKKDSTQGFVTEITSFTDQTTYAEFGIQSTTVFGTGSLPTNRDLNVLVTGSLTSTDELVKVSANDTTAGYLNGKLIAGTGVSLTENNDGLNETLTIANTSPNVDQNLWETMSSDAGSVAADTTTDTFTIAGGTGISTAIAGDTLTITNDSPNVDQNIWLNIDADAGGPVAADTTTDTLTIAGGTGISTAIAGDTLTITSTATVDQISDADGDTQIQVEESADDDTIRFDVGDTPAGYGAVADILTLASDGLAISMGTANAGIVGAPIQIGAGIGGANAAGGTTTVVGGFGNGTGDGGAGLFGAGLALGTGNGGDATLLGGSTSGTNADGGDAIVQGGASNGTGGDGGNVILAPGTGDQTGAVTIQAPTASLLGPELRFEDAAGGQYVGFQAPATVPTNIIWQLPDSGGSAGQALSIGSPTTSLIWSTPASTVPGSPPFAVQFNDTGTFEGNSQFLFDPEGGVALGSPSITGRITMIGNNAASNILSIGGTTQVDLPGPATLAPLYVELDTPGAQIDGIRVFFNRNAPDINGYIGMDYDGSRPNIVLVDEDDDAPYISFVVVGSPQFAGSPTVPNIPGAQFLNRFGGRNDPVGGTANATTGFEWTVNGVEAASLDTNFLRLPGGSPASLPATPVPGMIRYDTIGGQPFVTLIDTTRSNKILSVETSNYFFAEAALGNNDWVQIGTANDADASYIMPFDATIVSAQGFCENDNSVAKGIDLWVNTSVNSTIGTFPGTGTNTSFSDNTLDIDVSAGDRIRLRAENAGGLIQDTVITLRIKWRA